MKVLWPVAIIALAGKSMQRSNFESYDYEEHGLYKEWQYSSGSLNVAKIVSLFLNVISRFLSHRK